MRIVMVLRIVAVFFLCAGFAWAQETTDDSNSGTGQTLAEASDGNAADTTDTDDLLDSAALETLVGPVALYPDTLLNQVLVASTIPLEVIKADRLLSDNEDADIEALKSKIEAEEWDESVAVLATAFPDVLQDMAEHIDWTETMGIAMLAQTDDVLDAIQDLRNVAVANGALADTEQQTVEIVQDEVTQTNEVIIQPANPQVVYVPSYQPAEVFDSSIDDVIVGGLIAFSTVAIIDNIFDNDDHWHGYWGCRNCGGWGGRPIVRNPDIDLDIDGNVNIGNRLNLDRENLNIDRDNLNINRDGIGANRGDAARAGWKPDQNKRNDARNRIAEKRNPGGATKLPVKKPSATDDIRQKISTRTPGNADRLGGGAARQANLPRAGGGLPQANRPQAEARKAKTASLKERSTSRPKANIGKASANKLPKAKKGAASHKAFQKKGGGAKARKASVRGKKQVKRPAGNRKKRR